MSDSQTKYRNWCSSFLDNLPLAVLRTTVEGKVVYCNKAALSLFDQPSKQSFFSRPITVHYQNIRDRGILIQTLVEKGQVKDFILGFKKKRGTPFWCAVSAKAVKDDDGTLEFIDTVIRDVTPEPGMNLSPQQASEAISALSFVFTLDSQGVIIDVSHEHDHLFDYGVNELMGRPLKDFLSSKDKFFFSQALKNVQRHGKDTGIISFEDKTGAIHHLEFYAIAVTKNQDFHYELVIRDITELLYLKEKQLEQHKFQGVLEMAGGVAHRLNQPLTVINNLLGELMSEMSGNDPCFPKLVALEHQISFLNEIIKKISHIKQYASMSYVGGLKVVDIDAASTQEDRKSHDQKDTTR